LRDYSSVYRQRDSIVHERSFKEFSTFGYHIGYSTVLKTYFFSYTVTFVTGIFLFALLFLSYMMYLSEREYWVDYSQKPIQTWKVTEHNFQMPPSAAYYPDWLSQYDNCLWFTLVTMTTLGYGDIVPVAWQGRCFAVIAVLVGLVLTALIVGVVTNKLAPTEFESSVMSWLATEKRKNQREEYAATIIQSVWREYCNLKNIDDPQRRIRLKGRRIKASIRAWIKKLRAVNRNLTVAEKEEKEEEKGKKKDSNQELAQKMNELEKQLDYLLDQIKTTAKVN